MCEIVWEDLISSILEEKGQEGKAREESMEWGIHWFEEDYYDLGGFSAFEATTCTSLENSMYVSVLVLVLV